MELVPFKVCFKFGVQMYFYPILDELEFFSFLINSFIQDYGKLVDRKMYF